MCQIDKTVKRSTADTLLHGLRVITEFTAQFADSHCIHAFRVHTHVFDDRNNIFATGIAYNSETCKDRAQICFKLLLIC